MKKCKSKREIYVSDNYNAAERSIYVTLSGYKARENQSLTRSGLAQIFVRKFDIFSVALLWELRRVPRYDKYGCLKCTCSVV